MAAERAIEFLVNGTIHTPSGLDPTTLLVDYLHQGEVGLTGTKKGCGQGGCGACTVMLTRYDEESDAVVHSSINSCMRPLGALDGMAVTTTEGVGSIRDGVGPVQWEIVANNGSQCGYCTAGWVMNMHAELVRRDGDQPTSQEVQELFDGNLCRCTGYRPILYAMQHFAEGFSPHEGAMTCEIDPADQPARSEEFHTPSLPDEWKAQKPLTVTGHPHQWYRPQSLPEAVDLLGSIGQEVETKLVVGNTSIGIYDLYTEDPTAYIDIGRLPELRATRLDEAELVLGASTTYTELIEALDAAIVGLDDSKSTGLKALRYLAGRTAGHIVRNAASIAGNTMLVLRHINAGTPFPSDMFTAYCMAGTEVSVVSTKSNEVRRLPILDFAHEFADDKDFAKSVVIVEYHVPFTETNEFAQTYKTALRIENSHSILNAGFRVSFDANGCVSTAVIVIGGIGAVAFRASQAERFLHGRQWDNDTLTGLIDALRADAEAAVEGSAARMAGVPDEGFSSAYRLSLAESFAYKFWVEVASWLGDPIPEAVTSVAIRTKRPVSFGTQSYSSYPAEYPINRPFVKLGAFMQATGEALYTHDMALPPRGLHARFVVSDKAAADFSYVDADGANITASEVVDVLRERFAGVEGFITGQDVPFDNERLVPAFASTDPHAAPPLADPLFCMGSVAAYGQSIGLVLASNPVEAEAAAEYVKTHLIRYEVRTNEIVLGIQEGLNAGNVLPDANSEQGFPSHIWKITRPSSDLGWVGSAGESTVNGQSCRVTSTQLSVGSQIHFYMETQSAMAIPGEHGTLVVYSSTQSPDSVQKLICSTLGMPANKVDVRVTRVGGAYGGKTTRSPRPAAAAAVAAHVMGRPVHLAMRRETDTAMIGHRHPASGTAEVALANGGDDHGKILGLKADYYLDGGNSYDCSFTISDVLQLRADSSYMIPNYQTSCDVVKTSVASNGAFRSVGAIQGVMVVENAIEAAAADAGLDSAVVREQSLYELGDAVPDGQRLKFCYQREVWDYTIAFSGYHERLAEVEEFNRANKWTKRGISIIPVKYGSGYNAVFLEQAGALLEVFAEDGSVLVRQGGVEMGQGLNTKIAQIAAGVLDVPLSYVRVAESDTSVVPNPVSTGASTGTEFNGAAVRQAGIELHDRIEQYALALLPEHGADWCKSQGVDFWNYSEGWKTPLLDKDGNPDLNPDGSPKTPWQNIVRQANSERVNLSAQARARIPGGTGVVSPDAFEFKDGAVPELVNEFTGYTFSAACTEVEVDILTGETTVLKAHIVYDMGHSLNPAVDIGQIEGAFVQGVGYVTTEMLVWEAEGPERGRANTLNTWTYKPPAHTGVPLEMHVDLFPRGSAPSVGENPDLLYSAKEVGEPPVVLATSAFIAIKRAVYASRVERGIDGWFDLDAPATVQAVRAACALNSEDLSL